MSVSNADLVRRSVEAWNRSDWDVVESLCWPDVEGIAPKQWPEAEDSIGWPAFRRQLERLKDSWAEERFEADSVESVSEDVVLVHGRWRGRGDASGIELDIETWMVWRFRDAKATRVEYFLDGKEATEAAGL
jgi:ketosteroid isomerase-like protein